MVQECEEWAKLPLELHSFPTVEALATRATEADLRAMGERPALIDSLVDTQRNEWRVFQPGKLQKWTCHHSQSSLTIGTAAAS